MFNFFCIFSKNFELKSLISLKYLFLFSEELKYSSQSILIKNLGRKKQVLRSN